MCKLLVCVLTLYSILFGLTDCTSSFDQRQTGDLNVQIGLKNIHLIALLNSGNEDYVDYDYAYDYSEMTIKPQNGTTLKPLNVTSMQTPTTVTPPSTALADNTTEQTILGTDQRNNITEINTNSTEPISAVHNNDSVNGAGKPVIQEEILNQNANAESVNRITSTTAKVTVGVPTTVLPDSPNDATVTSSVSTTNCRRGFVQNNQGKCEYKVHGTSNALRRIVKLAQKIKIGRGITET